VICYCKTSTHHAISCKASLLLKIKSNFAHGKFIENLKFLQWTQKRKENIHKIKRKNTHLPPPFLPPEKILSLYGE
jgi:hypothetical protein